MIYLQEGNVLVVELNMNEAGGYIDEQWIAEIEVIYYDFIRMVNCMLVIVM